MELSHVSKFLLLLKLPKPKSANEIVNVCVTVEENPGGVLGGSNGGGENGGGG